MDAPAENATDYLDHMPLLHRRALLHRPNNLHASKWPGLPRGTKFDPTDADLLWHLLAKTRKGFPNASHPFIHQFINSLEDFHDINHTHPQNLPGVKEDGSASYFFHRPLLKHSDSFQKHYTWEAETETKPVYVDGIHQGFKKVYTLLIQTDDQKPEKTNWVLHQYHACTDDRDSDLVVSKLYCDVNSDQVTLPARVFSQGASLAYRNHNKAATCTDGKGHRRAFVKDDDPGQGDIRKESSDHIPLKKRNCKRQKEKKQCECDDGEASGRRKEVSSNECNSSRIHLPNVSTSADHHLHLAFACSNPNPSLKIKIKPEPISDLDETTAPQLPHSMLTINHHIKFEDKAPLNSSFPASSVVSPSHRPRRRKKTATDSVEEALEEDAPGLLKALIDRGIVADEIKLYGVGEDHDVDPLQVSSDDDFQDLQSVIAKFFSDRASFFKITTARNKKGDKAVYCLACLISLIEQTRYLKLHKNPVEWGWCRDLQSFIFVFKHHNRIVLERPEYGFATYFFELIPSLPIDWQIKRLITAMKINSRACLLQNKPLLVGEDLSEGEAKVLEEYGWIRNTGIGTMLKYCDRVVHDRWHESDSSEWRVKIGRLLMSGYNRGSVILSDIPTKVRKYMIMEEDSDSVGVGDDPSPPRKIKLEDYT